MNFKLFLLAATLSLPAVSGAAEPVLKFSHIDGWKVESVDSDPTLKKIFEGSQYVFFTVDEKAEERPIIRVRSLGDAAKLNPSKTSSWRSVLFPDNGETRVVTAQQILKGKGAPRYVAEFQTDTGTQTMLQSIVLASLVNGKIHILIYEQRRETYFKNIAAIKKLFQEVAINSEN